MGTDTPRPRMRWIAGLPSALSWALACTLAGALSGSCNSDSHAGESAVDVTTAFVRALLADDADGALRHTCAADREAWTAPTLRRLAELDDPLQTAYRAACELEDTRLAPHDVVRVHWRCPDPLWLEGRLLELGGVADRAAAATRLPTLVGAGEAPWVRQSLDVKLVREAGRWRVVIGARETALRLPGGAERRGPGETADITPAVSSAPGLPRL